MAILYCKIYITETNSFFLWISNFSIDFYSLQHIPQSVLLFSIAFYFPLPKILWRNSKYRKFEDNVKLD